MIIQVDQEGRKVIEQFCDIALKNGGMSNLNQINLVLATMVNISRPMMVPLSTRQPQQPEQPEQPEQSKPEE